MLSLFLQLTTHFIPSKAFFIVAMFGGSNETYSTCLLLWVLFILLTETPRAFFTMLFTAMEYFDTHVLVKGKL